MPLTVLYFAGAREAAGLAREALDLPAGTVADLRRALTARHPALARVLPRCRLAVNQEMASDAEPVPDGAEVAVIPPVSGGAPRCRVVERPLALDEAVEAVRGPGRGAVVTFEGDVRGETQGRPVVRLEYEAYLPMAERTLQRVADEVEREHGAAVAIVHRVGHLGPGEAAVVIACAAPHRTPAFRACEAAIERLKHEVPIWKREVFSDGSVWVGLGP
ncbi:molybdopterin converting factor subunit 1 [Anaeromyxobacter diazotrophicus]|uniref:Molybdopterin synthase catalytic subunit n=1 Tax=Anaeromyxobacter diazotrophicus TaxID=2590199 RepID=A0A7I9VSL5_9BACT|nr:molybdopterin converting factor subunit 1 [Anaeromyxobacter diazotrophicus]GEJ59434.1 molybdopterin synthase sulfur carrier subunit [Anaeromyxobacter diazotrophicus]